MLRGISVMILKAIRKEAMPSRVYLHCPVDSNLKNHGVLLTP